MKLANDALERVRHAFKGAVLGDPRRVQRLMRTVQKLAESPNSSFPQAMGSEADIEGAYRLMNNEHVTAEKLADAYANATAKRARGHARVLVIHDTTPCEFSHLDGSEVGYLNTGKAGFYAHYSLVVTADGTRRPLGVVNVEAHSRSKRPSKSKKKSTARKASGADTAKKADREFLRWSRGFSRATERLKKQTVINIADREADSYDLFAGCIQRKEHFVVRLRVTARNAVNAHGVKAKLRTIADACTGSVAREVPLSARKAGAARTARAAPKASKAHPVRDARVAKLSFSATRVELSRPRYAEAELETISLNLVRVFENDPPAGEKPIEWLLYTTEPVDTEEQVKDIVDMYRARWLIEECNKAIKTGCRYEDRQFETYEALLNLFVMTLPVACELLWLRSCCRADPEQPATNALTDVQLRILAHLVPKLAPRPTVHQALWAVASIGGHMRGNGEPGWQILYRGLAKLMAYEGGWLLREGAAGLVQG